MSNQDLYKLVFIHVLYFTLKLVVKTLNKGIIDSVRTTHLTVNANYAKNTYLNSTQNQRKKLNISKK